MIAKSDAMKFIKKKKKRKRETKFLFQNIPRKIALTSYLWAYKIKD